MGTYDKVVTVPISSLKPGCRVLSVVTYEDLRPAERLPYLEHGFYSSFPSVAVRLSFTLIRKSTSMRTSHPLEEKGSTRVFSSERRPALDARTIRRRSSHLSPQCGGGIDVPHLARGGG